MKSGAWFSWSSWNLLLVSQVSTTSIVESRGSIGRTRSCGWENPVFVIIWGLHNDFIISSHRISFLARLKVSHTLSYLEGLDPAGGLRSWCFLYHWKCALKVEKLDKLVDVEVLGCLMTLDIFNNDMLIQLKAILNTLLVNGGKESLNYLCNLSVILTILIESHDPICNLALFGGRFNSLLDPAHYLLHLLQSTGQWSHCPLIKDAESNQDWRCWEFMDLGRHIFEIRASLVWRVLLIIESTINVDDFCQKVITSLIHELLMMSQELCEVSHTNSNSVRVDLDLLSLLVKDLFTATTLILMSLIVWIIWARSLTLFLMRVLLRRWRSLPAGGYYASHGHLSIWHVAYPLFLHASPAMLDMLSE